jgi:hypothetical protein
LASISRRTKITKDEVDGKPVFLISALIFLLSGSGIETVVYRIVLIICNYNTKKAKSVKCVGYLPLCGAVICFFGQSCSINIMKKGKKGGKKHKKAAKLSKSDKDAANKEEREKVMEQLRALGHL